MRVSLLLLLLWLATGIGCAWFVGRGAVCLGGVCESHQTALHSQTLTHHIVGPVHSGFEPEMEFPE